MFFSFDNECSVSLFSHHSSNSGIGPTLVPDHFLSDFYPKNQRAFFTTFHALLLYLFIYLLNTERLKLFFLLPLRKDISNMGAWYVLEIA